jgi:alpha-galactosidase
MSERNRVSRSVHQPSQAELAEAKQWAADNLLSADTPPFRFIYEAKPSAELLKDWEHTCQDKQLPGQGVEYVITYRDPKTRLELSCQAMLFDDYPAVEWVLHFHNPGQSDTPILEDIQSLDMTLTRDERPDIQFPESEFLLHRYSGCACRSEDYMAWVDIMQPEHKTRIHSVGGRSSSGGDAWMQMDGSLPFFNVQAVDHGAIIAVGWTGQWAATLRRVCDRDLHISAGMELTHLKLLTGETIRTPRMLVFFWQGDRIAAHNKFRQFILDHHTPQQEGRPLQVPLAGLAAQPSVLLNEVTEENRFQSIRAVAARKVPLEHFWLDAGWYGTEGNWGAQAGSWFPRKDVFPYGLKPLADEARKFGMGFVLWFEPERVYPNTQLYNEHPEWLLMPAEGEESPCALLNLGNPEARAWLIDLISRMIDETGLTVYRQDMNFDPLSYWRNTDPPDRQGITEIRHIEGLYTFWDELRKRYPDLIIDNCATGCRRLDFEMISRSIVLWRSDHTHPHAVQSHGHALAQLVPTTAGICEAWGHYDSYAFRSAFGAGMSIHAYMDEPGCEQQWEKNIREVEEVRPLFYGDFYSLTGQCTQKNAWLGYQLYRQDLRRGAVICFRREESAYTTASFKLSGLDRDAVYELTDADTGSNCTLSGEQLMAGFEVTLPRPKSSHLTTYRQLDNRDF